MDYIIVSFCFEDRTEDLKIPTFVPIGDLVILFMELFGARGKALHAEPRGIILDKNKTLAEQGVEHGAILTLE
ncbi:MAG: EsaB/YukD family protein [Clostridiales bacterium]|jgi:uncharacterized ubiquitin-like protein YukD|nr:EsaB/YukD family protein [Clostridiales bacterium]